MSTVKYPSSQHIVGLTSVGAVVCPHCIPQFDRLNYPWTRAQPLVFREGMADTCIFCASPLESIKGWDGHSVVRCYTELFADTHNLSVPA
jgi:hypothetical protein